MARKMLIGMAGLTDKQRNCIHFTVRRILDYWKCLDCDLEFVPKRLIKGNK